MTVGHIDDGYNAKGFIKGEAGLFPDVHFEFRPAASDESVPHYDRYKDLSAKDQLARTYGMLAKHLVSWDLKDSKGRTPKCSDASSMRKLPLPLLYRMESMITLMAAPDEDPQAKPEPGMDGYADETPAGN